MNWIPQVFFSKSFSYVLFGIFEYFAEEEQIFF